MQKKKDMIKKKTSIRVIQNVSYPSTHFYFYFDVSDCAKEKRYDEEENEDASKEDQREQASTGERCKYNSIVGHPTSADNSPWFFNLPKDVERRPLWPNNENIYLPLKEKEQKRRQKKEAAGKSSKAARDKRREQKVKAEYPYECLHCEWRFMKKRQLHLHKAWHQDEICCWCGVSYIHARSLRKHLIEQHGRKQRRCGCYVVWDRTVRQCERKRENHMCPRCGESYESKSQSRRHTRCRKALHHGRKCCFCFETHLSLASLDRHKSLFHPRKRRLVCFECKYCGKMMADFQSFRWHISRHEKKYRRYWLQPVTWSCRIFDD